MRRAAAAQQLRLCSVVGVAAAVGAARAKEASLGRRSGAADATVPSFHFGLGNGLLPGGMGDPQLYWCAPCPAPPEASPRAR